MNLYSVNEWKQIKCLLQLFVGSYYVNNQKFCVPDCLYSVCNCHMLNMLYIFCWLDFLLQINLIVFLYFKYICLPVSMNENAVICTVLTLKLFQWELIYSFSSQKVYSSHWIHFTSIYLNVFYMFLAFLDDLIYFSFLSYCIINAWSWNDIFATCVTTFSLRSLFVSVVSTTNSNKNKSN